MEQLGYVHREQSKNLENLHDIILTYTAETTLESFKTKIVLQATEIKTLRTTKKESLRDEIYGSAIKVARVRFPRSGR